MLPLKIFLRNIMSYKRNLMTQEECFNISETIQKTVYELHEWGSADSINIYKSIGNEVSTKKLIKDVERYRSKYLYYPTPEPEANMLDVDLVIVPGVVFDEKRARYGRGKGYYDRFLDQLPKTTCIIGIAYDFQVLPYKWKLKLDETDVKMDMIITEKRIIKKRGTLNYKE